MPSEDYEVLDNTVFALSIIYNTLSFAVALAREGERQSVKKAHGFAYRLLGSLFYYQK